MIVVVLQVTAPGSLRWGTGMQVGRALPGAARVGTRVPISHGSCGLGETSSLPLRRAWKFRAQTRS